MKPEDVERIKDLLPTDLGSDEIRGKIAADILRRSVFSARMASASYLAKIREVCTELSAGKINQADARAQLLSVLDRPTESRFAAGVVHARLSKPCASNLLDFNESAHKANARKTRSLQTAWRESIRLGDFAILQHPFNCVKPFIKPISIEWISCWLFVAAPIKKLAGRCGSFTKCNEITSRNTFQRGRVGRRLQTPSHNIRLQIIRKGVFLDLLAILHGFLPPEENLNPPCMAVRNSAWERKTPYKAGRGYYSHVITGSATVSYFRGCRIKEMISHNHRENQAVVRLFASGANLASVSMFALNPITKTVASRIKNEPNYSKRHEGAAKLQNETPEMEKELVYMKDEFHSKIITRNAA